MIHQLRMIHPLRIILIAVMGCAVTTTAASAAYVNFRVPSRNIACAFSSGDGPTTLRCEIASHMRPTPPMPAGGCNDGVWGRAVAMTPRGRAGGICISDTIMDPNAQVLRYGKSWSRGGFTCKSRKSGLTCRNRAGHGWFLSKQRSRLF